jgi:hypothetical protein
MITSTGAESIRADALPLGLISESQFDRSELFGFEIDMSGKVIVPDFLPGRVTTGALPAAISLASQILTAVDVA